MNSEELEQIGTPSFRTRLRQARKQAGLDEQELAVEMGVSSASYYDLENCDGELDDVILLIEFLRLCRKLRVTPEYLLGIEPSAKKISAEEFRVKVQEGVLTGQISILDLERIRCDIKPFLADSSKMTVLYLDCLRYICRALEIDWHSIIPEIEES